MSGITVDRMAFVVAMVVKQPRSALELSNLIGCKPDTVRCYLKALEDEGVLRHMGRGKYGWAA